MEQLQREDVITRLMAKNLTREQAIAKIDAFQEAKGPIKVAQPVVQSVKKAIDSKPVEPTQKAADPKPVKPAKSPSQPKQPATSKIDFWCTFDADQIAKLDAKAKVDGLSRSKCGQQMILEAIAKLV